MSDVFSKRKRSWIMGRVRGKDTKPELAVRSVIRELGLRQRGEGTALPGKPDIIFNRLKRAVFVHGCFWHGHSCRGGMNRPHSNTRYWTRKLAGNTARDKKNQAMLRKSGWRVLVVWECQLRNEAALRTRLAKFLGVTKDGR